MVQKMRRNKQKLSAEECEALLKQNTSGVLALVDNDGSPYAVPLSYVYSQNKLYFHSAAEGHKIAAIQACEKASFCVIDQDQVVPQEYTTYYRSVIAFGTVRISTDEQESEAAMRLLALKYYPQDSEEHRIHTIEASKSEYEVLVFTIERMSGKQARELIKGKR